MNLYPSRHPTSGVQCERWDLPTAHWDDSHSGGDVRWPARIDVDLFAGPGGLDEGRRLAGRDELPLLGIEWEPWACRTAHAAGHTRVRADVRTFPTAHLRGKVRLLLGSPPCTKFSAAGNGAGRLALDLFVSAIGPMLAGNDVRAWVERQHADMLCGAAGDDEKAYTKADAEAADAVLVLEPARWIRDVQPQAVVLEQVPAVLPIWQALARELRARKRAILIASRARAVAPPEPTHAEHPAPDLFGGERFPWVSMANALGWHVAPVVNTRGDRGENPAGGNEFSASRPSWALTEKARTWELRIGTNENATRRPVDEPAGTLFFGHQCNDVSWVVRTGNNSMVTGAFPEGTVRITTTEAATLQGFRPDYPWRGNRTSAFGQVGNAVPPPLAAVCVTAALGPPPLAAGAAPARQEAD